MLKKMNARVVQSCVALVLTVLSGSALADTAWLPTPDTLRFQMRTSQSVVIGRLTDVHVEEHMAVVVARVTDVQVEQRLATMRSGSGRIAVEEFVAGARVVPTISWSDRTEITCPSLRLDEFKDRVGIWFVHVDAWGVFDGWSSKFWDFELVTRMLDKIEESGPLRPTCERSGGPSN
ncbi:MAG TPA: hypothetical protein VGQ46_11725 [Thermoanaerobaculia bacterium]|jgi:hypothetical protein|nr:hypothetical protein [Thermoanaerobaculia bacterium]